MIIRNASIDFKWQRITESVEYQYYSLVEAWLSKSGYHQETTWTN
ncbi:hypothetical protein [Lactobacillus johnsonii]|nr:hypothetical protein [Lactobacillus johnsonii]